MSIFIDVQLNSEKLRLGENRRNDLYAEMIGGTPNLVAFLVGSTYIDFFSSYVLNITDRLHRTIDLSNLLIACACVNSTIVMQ